MTSEDFIVNVKTKYGNQRTRDGQLISDLDDKELLKKMLDRYPGERENIEDVDEYLGEGELTEAPAKTDVQATLDTAKKGLFARIGDRFGEMATKAQGIEESNFNPASKFLQSAGAGAGFLGDVVLEGAKAITPDFIEEGISSGIQKIAQTEPVQKAAEAYGGFKEENPELAGNIEAGLSIAGVVPAGKVVGAGAKAVGKATEKALPVIDKATEGMRQAKIVKQKAEVDDAVGRIIQGTPEDIAKAKNALSNIDTDGLKTYDELNTRINERVGVLSSKMDEMLDEQAPSPLSSTELANRIEVNGKTVFQTPVQDALKEGLARRNLK